VVSLCCWKRKFGHEGEGGVGGNKECTSKREQELAEFSVRHMVEVFRRGFWGLRAGCSIISSMHQSHNDILYGKKCGAVVQGWFLLLPRSYSTVIPLQSS